MHLPILSILIFLPLVTALLLFLLVDGSNAKAIRHIALLATVINFVISIALWAQFNPHQTGFQFAETHPWVRGYGISYALGIDGISLVLILLTTLLMPICLLASSHVTERIKEYMISFLVMESIIIGTFAALDMVLFYLFFEGVLIPMFIIIGIWGGQNRVYAAFKFFLYTLAGSVLLLIALIYMYSVAHTTSIPELIRIIPALPGKIQAYLWLALFASFAVKVPMWPFHTWLPDAHVQAPTAGSVILAGVLLKLGAYGFLRFSLPMLPTASHAFAPVMFVLSVIAIIYTSLVALVQEDMKKLIAYSSVAHMGFVTLAIFTFTPQGIDGAVFQMISHGIVSGALFLCVGVVYDRQHTREIKMFGGLTERMPKYALLFMIFTMGSVGLPATSGFIGEFLTFIAAFQVQPVIAALATTGVIFGAAYMLWLYRRVMFGELNKTCENIMDLDRIEIFNLSILALLVIVLGVYPELVFGLTRTSISNLILQVNR